MSDGKHMIVCIACFAKIEEEYPYGDLSHYWICTSGYETKEGAAKAWEKLITKKVA